MAGLGQAGSPQKFRQPLAIAQQATGLRRMAQDECLRQTVEKRRPDQLIDGRIHRPQGFGQS
jgi:hypothetical protein